MNKYDNCPGLSSNDTFSCSVGAFTIILNAHTQTAYFSSLLMFADQYGSYIKQSL